jgi:hypothetical protein
MPQAISRHSAMAAKKWDAMVWAVGNATQAPAYQQAVYGMGLVAYADPETGLRDRQSYVLRSAARLAGVRQRQLQGLFEAIEREQQLRGNL